MTFFVGYIDSCEFLRIPIIKTYRSSCIQVGRLGKDKRHVDPFGFPIVPIPILHFEQIRGCL